MRIPGHSPYQDARHIAPPRIAEQIAERALCEPRVRQAVMGVKELRRAQAKIGAAGAWTTGRLEVTDGPTLPPPTRTWHSQHVETIALPTLTAGPIFADSAKTRMVATYIPEVDTPWFAAPFARQLALEETAALQVDVAAFSVAFDEARGLWYADIEFQAATAYTPFVRLALARYQSHSITGVELSRIVLADFAQLSPDRSAVLIIDRASPQNARLFVGGLAPQGPRPSSIQGDRAGTLGQRRQRCRLGSRLLGRHHRHRPRPRPRQGRRTPRRRPLGRHHTVQESPRPQLMVREGPGAHPS